MYNISMDENRNQCYNGCNIIRNSSNDFKSIVHWSLNVARVFAFVLFFTNFFPTLVQLHPSNIAFVQNVCSGPALTPVKNPYILRPLGT